MGIIIIEKGKITPYEKTNAYKDEDELQREIEEHPNILPLAAAKNQKLLTVHREYEMQAGRADLILIDDAGMIYIVETKLHANTTKREIIAQIIDYASDFFFEQRFDEFINEIKDYFKKYGKTFEEEAKRLYGEDNFEQIIANMNENFEDGRFNLVVTMDKVDKQVIHMIDFVNKGNFRIFGNELETYKIDAENRIIVPRIVGSESDAERTRTTPSSNRRTFTVEEFKIATDKLPTNVKKAVLRILDYSVNKLGDYKSRNASTPGFKITANMLGIKCTGNDKVLLQVQSDGTLFDCKDSFIDPKTKKYSGRGSEMFYSDMKKILGTEAYALFVTPDGYFLDAEYWIDHVDEIIELLEKVRVAEKR